MRTADDETRRRIIDSYGVIGAPTEPDLEGLVRLAATVCDVPTAVINIIDDRSQHQIAAVGIEPAVCAREDSMCAVVFREPGHVVLADASSDPRFRDNPFVTGEIADVRFYASSPLITPVGVPIGTVCVFDDVVRDLDADAGAALALIAHQIVDVLELRRTTRELGQVNELLESFAAQVAHDLRNPLTALTGYLELAAEAPGVEALPAVTRALGRAESAATRMSGMITQLLDYARVGGAPVRARPVEVRPVVEAVVDDLRAAGTDVDVEVDAQVPVHADPVLFSVLVQNLVCNAAKFARSAVGGPRVHVTTRSIDGGVRLVVDDNGPGIPADERERVFEPLERGSVRDVPGFGIGLSTCRRVVDAHGGVLGADAAPLGGARIWAFLPEPTR